MHWSHTWTCRHFTLRRQVQRLPRRSSTQQLCVPSPDGPGDVIHVLRLDDCLQVILQDAREVVLQLRASEVGQYLLPVWWGLCAKGEHVRSVNCTSKGGAGRSQGERYGLLRTSNLPRLGFNLPARIFNAVDFPMPLVPTKPRTCPGRGVGNLP